MNRRRILGETLSDVARGACEAAARMPGLAVRRLEIALPIELVVAQRGGAWQVFGDLPRTLTRTPFDIEPGRVSIIWAAEERP